MQRWCGSFRPAPRRKRNSSLSSAAFRRRLRAPLLRQRPIRSASIWRLWRMRSMIFTRKIRSLPRRTKNGRPAGSAWLRWQRISWIRAWIFWGWILRSICRNLQPRRLYGNAAAHVRAVKSASGSLNGQGRLERFYDDSTFSDWFLLEGRSARYWERAGWGEPVWRGGVSEGRPDAGLFLLLWGRFIRGRVLSPLPWALQPFSDGAWEGSGEAGDHLRGGARADPAVWKARAFEDGGRAGEGGGRADSDASHRSWEGGPDVPVSGKEGV